MNLLLLTCLFLIVTLTTSSTISWYDATVIVKQSDAVNLTCTATDITNHDVIRIDLRTTDGQHRTIADNVDIKVPFSVLKRYSVKYRYRDSIGHLTLSLNDVRGEDAGHLVCYLLSDKDSSAEVHLKVNVPVKQVYLTTIAADGSRKRMGLGSVQGQVGENDSGDIILREMEDRGVMCDGMVEGSSTPPSLFISINDRDMTHFFVAAEEAKRVAKVDDLDSLYGEMKLTYVSMSPERDWNGQRLKCTAVSDGFPPVSVSAILSVQYIPVLSCSAYEYYGLAGQSITVSCQVSANPSSLVAWSQRGDKMTSKQRIVADAENIQLIERVIKSDETTLIMKIKTIDPSLFGMYFLSAQNEIGSAEVAIVLHLASGGIDLSASGMGQFAALQQMLPPGMQMPSSSQGGTWRSSILLLVLALVARWVCRTVLFTFNVMEM